MVITDRLNGAKPRFLRVGGGYQARLTKRLSATVLRKSYREQIETLATKYETPLSSLIEDW